MSLFMRQCFRDFVEPTLAGRLIAIESGPDIPVGDSRQEAAILLGPMIAVLKFKKAAGVHSVPRMDGVVDRKISGGQLMIGEVILGLFHGP